MRITVLPHCCGIAVVSHFGFDQRHNWRPENRQDIVAVETTLRAYARDAATGEGAFATAGIGAVGMLVAALNNHQKTHLHDTLMSLGWRRAGKCNNLHTNGETNVYLYRKVIAEENERVNAN